LAICGRSGGASRAPSGTFRRSAVASLERNVDELFQHDLGAPDLHPRGAAHRHRHRMGAGVSRRAGRVGGRIAPEGRTSQKTESIIPNHDSLELVSKPCQARVLSANSPTASSGRQAPSRETPLRRAAGHPVRGHPLSVLKPVLITNRRIAESEPRIQRFRDSRFEIRDSEIRDSEIHHYLPIPSLLARLAGRPAFRIRRCAA